MQKSPRTFLQKRLDPAGRYGLRLTLFAIAVALVAIPFGFLLDQVVRRGELISLDTAAARNLHHLIAGHPLVIWVLKVVTFLGTPVWFYFIVAVASVFLWRRGRNRLVAYLITTSLVGGAIDSVVKILVDRPRPSLEEPIITAHGKSFPSGHAMSSTVVYGALLLTFLPAIPKRRRIIMLGAYLVLIMSIGFSRLALGVHYLTDVLGGYALGAAWLIASTAAFSIWRQERGREPVDIKAGVEPEARRDLKV